MRFLHLPSGERAGVRGFCSSCAKYVVRPLLTNVGWVEQTEGWVFARSLDSQMEQRVDSSFVGLR
jgi:hypothetical protein